MRNRGHKEEEEPALRTLRINRDAGATPGEQEKTAG
jgi:hypothetical protein